MRLTMALQDSMLNPSVFKSPSAVIRKNKDQVQKDRPKPQGL